MLLRSIPTLVVSRILGSMGFRPLASRSRKHARSGFVHLQWGLRQPSCCRAHYFLLFSETKCLQMLRHLLVHGFPLARMMRAYLSFISRQADCGQTGLSRLLSGLLLDR